MLEAPALAVDDTTLLEGAASVWAVMTYAGDLPATPENKAALARARAVFLKELGELGLDVSDLERYLDDFRTDRGFCQGRGSPPGV